MRYIPLRYRLLIVDNNKRNKPSHTLKDMSAFGLRG
jgi:hypothetical protein